MENKNQTQVTDQNRKEFQEQLNQHTGNFDLDLLNEQTIIAIDCQGHNYQLLYPSKTILALETMSNVSDFKIPKEHFHKFIDNRQYNKLGWPRLDVKNCAVLFDCSPILKYRTVEEISAVLDQVSNKYLPTTIIVNLNLMHIDDNRLLDRFYNMAEFKLNLYVIHEFLYNANGKSLIIKFYRKTIL